MLGSQFFERTKKPPYSFCQKQIVDDRKKWISFITKNKENYQHIFDYDSMIKLLDKINKISDQDREELILDFDDPDWENLRELSHNLIRFKTACIA